ncbi:hypothetical protein Mal64_12020 [Pseudobythopirellula maris]|uniref:DUF2007 domain-containing protein n=1 Tax=Pseudobythopirellula maris TaxID=2527991 RepID=A0A5C5ZUL2_9BACT|nr:DUF2007 domain-containing protein [Pseudobythopirellula maris]TWT90805.1 hypothetical protein Mal64_12020 [Pseudobythopirellula maris]
MNLEDPIAAFNAADNFEAAHVAELLSAKGVPAQVIEDTSMEVFGFISGAPRVMNPQVWVSRQHKNRAAELLNEYRQRKAAEASPPQHADGATISAQCEECSRLSMFPASLDGTTQLCQYCKAHVDVGLLDWADVDFGEPEDD